MNPTADYPIIFGDQECYLHVQLTEEGIIADVYDNDQELVGTWATTAQELAERIEAAQ